VFTLLFIRLLLSYIYYLYRSQYLNNSFNLYIRLILRIVYLDKMNESEMNNTTPSNNVRPSVTSIDVSNDKYITYCYESYI